MVIEEVAVEQSNFHFSLNIISYYYLQFIIIIIIITAKLMKVLYFIFQVKFSINYEPNSFFVNFIRHITLHLNQVLPRGRPIIINYFNKL